jgi:hypothetical protein
MQQSDDALWSYNQSMSIASSTVNPEQVATSIQTLPRQGF